MSAISHFQVYVQRENHVTNNTMLMLRHVYRTSPKSLETTLQALMEEDDIEIGPRFEQQVGEAHSIPDAVLSQKPLHVYLEAKHGNALYDDQLERHVRSIGEKKHTENSAFLIGLTVSRVSDEDLERWRMMALEYGVTFVATTYRELLDVLSSVCANSTGLQEVLDDYQSFIGGEGLMPDQHRKLVAMLCGQSWQENIEYGVYFEPANRNPKWTRAHFIGIYHRKSISHIGRIVASAVCRMQREELIVDGEEFGEFTDEHKERIAAAINAATYYQDLAAHPHRYYLVDNYSETEVRKVSSGGMMGHRYFDIAELAGCEQWNQDASSEDVASMIRGATYE
ncbi:MAG: hypothetical protein RJS97_22230 [Parvibaculaceae bacterium]